MGGPLELFASCVPGLEPLLAAELRGLGIDRIAEERGGLGFDGDLRVLYRANLELGLAAHVLVRIGSFTARRLPALRRKVAELGWEPWLTASTPIRIRATARRSRLYHTGAIEERVRLGIADRLGGEPPAGDDVPLAVRVDHDVCTISLDSSGEPLHRRGWRLETAKAPLREDLARALVVASGWDPRTPLCDPMAGAGTVAIEAACLARGLAPGRLRRFALEHTARFHDALLRELKDGLDAAALDRAPAPIVARDRADGAVSAARGNAERCGVAGDVEIAHADLEAPLPDLGPTGALVTNPPYGKRIANQAQVDRLYARLAETCARLPAGWRIAVLSAEPRRLEAAGLRLRRAFTADHGGIRVHAMVG